MNNIVSALTTLYMCYSVYLLEKNELTFAEVLNSLMLYAVVAVGIRGTDRTNPTRGQSKASDCERPAVLKVMRISFY